MTLNQLHYFQTIAETGSMRTAADTLFISQPSLSVAMANLEKELGVSLFIRKHQRLALTPEGEALLTHADRILSEADDALIHMKRLAEDRNTNLRVGLITPLLRDYFPEKMKGFLRRKENRGVHFDFAESTTTDLVRGMKNGTFDLLLCSAHEDAEILQVPLITEPMILLAPENCRTVPETWKDLAAIPLIGYNRHTATDQILSRIAQENSITFEFSYRAPNEDSICALVEHGLGFAVIPEYANLSYYRVKKIPLPTKTAARIIYLTTPAERPCAGAAARFIRYLEEEPEKI